MCILIPLEPENMRKLDEETPYGFNGDGRDLPAGSTKESLLDKLGPLENKLEPIEDKLKEGIGKTPTAIEFNPAMILQRICRSKYMTN